MTGCPFTWPSRRSPGQLSASAASAGRSCCAVMLSIGLVAIDSTILATAVPSIVDDLGGFTQFPWLFSIYLLAQAVSVPIYGKLADLYGRKPVMLLGIGLVRPGLDPVRLRLEHAGAHRLPRVAGPRRRRGAADGHDDRRRHLLPGRARQGAGLHRQRLGDLLRRRTRPWAGSSPTTCRGAGSSSSTCRWAIAAGWVMWRRFDEHVTRAQAHHRLRRRRAAGGGRLPAHPRSAGGRGPLGLGLARRASHLLRSAAVLLAAFVAVERRAPEPVLPLWIFRSRLLNRVEPRGSRRRRLMLTG